VLVKSPLALVGGCHTVPEAGSFAMSRVAHMTGKDWPNGASIDVKGRAYPPRIPTSRALAKTSSWECAPNACRRERTWFLTVASEM
jgi:hypothetical protein